ncbi:hypothetical protein [uncultured Microscilla sp.]|uniref:hypothetical protein n=1 Tax=uncultured Microscilla sp. TaxID=432653 RepID=UPI00262BFFF0|nr:hypothetical protein [uncultured Microscilla sp.]
MKKVTLSIFLIIQISFLSCKPIKDNKAIKKNGFKGVHNLQSLNNLIVRCNVYQKKQSDNTLIQIQKRFKGEPATLKKVVRLKKSTLNLMQFINKLRVSLIKNAGQGINENTHTLMTPHEKQKVRQYMVIEKNAYVLEKKLNNYVSFINKEYQEFGIPKMLLIAKGNEHNILYKDDPIKSKQKFVELYFENTPVILALAYLSCFQNTVLRYEEEVFKYMILSLVDKK